MRLFSKSDTSTMLASGLQSRAVSLLRLLWLVLLVLPAASSNSTTEGWDLDSNLLFGVSCWLVVAARLVLPARWFFPASLPIALAGVSCMGADFLRHVDLLELAIQWRTFRLEEVRSSLLPYAGVVVMTSLVLGAWCWACALGPDPRRCVRAVPVGVALVTLLLASVVPQIVWVRAWPTNLMFVVGTAAWPSNALVSALRPAANIDPRDPKATWHGRSTRSTPRQTFVFIVGESVRADFLRECHGPGRVRAVSDGAVVACDVTSGADATHSSVPLLVSRDMPGRPYRVSPDATFERAFEEAGFETHWISVQGRSVAWPDAQFQQYPMYFHSDESALGPQLAKALERPAQRKAIVLHAYNAHAPYCTSFDAASAPYPTDCKRLEGAPRAADREVMRLAYADAIDSSVRFIDSVIDTLRDQPGEVFLLFTPDHGDNLYDDPRQLYGHALRNPTRWDVRVPAIFWANGVWRAAHPQQWANLKAQADAPLMHADMVPTFLAAAGVVYDEPRKQAIDLLDATVPPRKRTIQRAPGVTTDWDTLVREAL